MNRRPYTTSYACGLLLLLLPTLAWAQAQPPSQAPQARLALARELIRAREPSAPLVLHAVFESDVTGPAAEFPFVRNAKGTDYRQINVQEWWVRDTWVAVVMHTECTAWLDGKTLVDIPAGDVPSHTYVHDGERTYFLDVRDGQRVLGLNAAWPYRGCAYPVLFGRSVSAQGVGEILDAGVDYLGEASLEGHPCSAISFANTEKVHTRLWLAEDLQGLCTRREVHGERGVVLEESYRFANGPRGIAYPAEATQRQFTRRGNALTTKWRMLEFEVDAPIPSHLLALSPDDADIVFDMATGQQLKPALGNRQ